MISTPSESPLSLREQIWSRVRLECADEIRAVFLAVAEHKTLHAELSTKCLLPNQAKEMLEIQERIFSAESPSAERLAFQNQVLSELKSIAQNPSVQFNAKRNANKLFLAAEPLWSALEVAAEKSLDSIISELVQKELEFFCSFGLPYEETSVKRIALQEKARIRNHPYAHGKKSIVDIPAGDACPKFDMSGLKFLFLGQTV